VDVQGQSAKLTVQDRAAGGHQLPAWKRGDEEFSSPPEVKESPAHAGRAKGKSRVRALR